MACTDWTRLNKKQLLEYILAVDQTDEAYYCQVNKWPLPQIYSLPRSNVAAPKTNRKMQGILLDDVAVFE